LPSRSPFVLQTYTSLGYGVLKSLSHLEVGVNFIAALVLLRHFLATAFLLAFLCLDQTSTIFKLLSQSLHAAAAACRSRYRRLCLHCAGALSVHDNCVSIIAEVRPENPISSLLFESAQSVFGVLKIKLNKILFFSILFLFLLETCRTWLVA